jgi:signal peptidase I
MKLLKNLVAVSAAMAALLGFVALILVMAGFRPFILKTKSMELIYTQGSLCWVDTRVSLNSLKVGDVLVYRSPANSLVLHRLVGIWESNTPSSLSAVIQGDANELTQDVELSHINYVGREAFSIPGLGSAVDKLISHHVIWITVAVFVLLACVPWESVKRRNTQ